MLGTAGIGSSTIFCQFYANDSAWAAGQPYATEFYDIDADPHQMTNAASTLTPARTAELVARLDQLRACKGADACGPNSGRNA